MGYPIHKADSTSLIVQKSEIVTSAAMLLKMTVNIFVEIIYFLIYFLQLKILRSCIITEGGNHMKSCRLKLTQAFPLC